MSDEEFFLAQRTIISLNTFTSSQFYITNKTARVSIDEVVSIQQEPFPSRLHHPPTNEKPSKHPSFQIGQ